MWGTIPTRKPVVPQMETVRLMGRESELCRTKRLSGSFD